MEEFISIINERYPQTKSALQKKLLKTTNNISTLQKRIKILQREKVKNYKSIQNSLKQNKKTIDIQR